MASLPPEKWTATCTDLARYLAYARPELYQTSVSALSLLSDTPREFTPYSSSLHKPFFIVGQLMAVSYMVWQRAYLDAPHHKSFIAFMWAHVLQEHFAAARVFLASLSTQAATRFDQLLSLFTSLAPHLVHPSQPGDALLLACHVGIPLAESSFVATARAFADPFTPSITKHALLPSAESPLFDRGFVEHVRSQRARPAGA